MKEREKKKEKLRESLEKVMNRRQPSSARRRISHISISPELLSCYFDSIWEVQILESEIMLERENRRLMVDFVSEPRKAGDNHHHDWSKETKQTMVLE